MMEIRLQLKIMATIYVRRKILETFVKIFIFIAKINYDKRNKFNPHYINTVIGGFQNGQRYLASVDLHGMKLESNFACYGFASYFAKPILTNYWNPDMPEDQAKKILHKCFEVLFYRDCK